MTTLKKLGLVFLLFLVVTGFFQIIQNSYLLGSDVKALCCNNGFCDGAVCSYASTVQSENYLGCSEDVNINCKTCIDLQRADKACGHQDRDEYCLDASNNKYYVCDPLSVSISGPEELDPGESGTFTASITGGTSSFSYQWYRRVNCVYDPKDGGSKDTPCGVWYTYGSNSSSVSASAWQSFSMKVRVTDSCPAGARVVTSAVWTVSVGSKGLAKQTMEKVPSSFEISAYPNPFNPTTEIKLFLPESGMISADIYNSRGQKIKTLTTDNYRQAGWHSFQWNALDDNGNFVGSGVYLCRFNIDDSIKTIKLSVLK